MKAQDAPSFTITFNHVALSVQDIDASATFYKNILQLSEITNRTKKPGIRWFSLGEDKELHLISTVPGKSMQNKAVHMALTTTTFSKVITALKQLKIPYSDWVGAPNTITTRADGVKQIYFQDPDGYWIELNSAATK